MLPFIIHNDTETDKQTLSRITSEQQRKIYTSSRHSKNRKINLSLRYSREAEIIIL
jgi:hypothetical protein